MSLRVEDSGRGPGSEFVSYARDPNSADPTRTHSCEQLPTRFLSSNDASPDMERLYSPLPYSSDLYYACLHIEVTTLQFYQIKTPSHPWLIVAMTLYKALHCAVPTPLKLTGIPLP